MKYNKRKDGRLQARVRINNKYKYFYAYSVADLKEKVERAYLTKEILIEKEYTFSKWFLEWFDTYKSHLSYRTKVLYKKTIELHVLPYLKNVKLKSIKQADIVRILNKLSPKLKKDTYILLNNIFEKALENDLIIKNVCKGIRVENYHAPEKKTIPHDIISKLDTNDPECFMFLFLIYTGLRRGELVALTPHDIDLDNKVINVNKSTYYKSNQAIIKSTKNGDTRQVPIFDIIYPGLLKLMNNKYLFTGVDKTKMCSEQTLKRKLEKVRKLVGYNFTYHQCRHTFVTLMYEAGIEPKQAQKWSGHRDINVLLNIYTHLSEKKNLENISKMNDFLNNSVSN